MKIFLDTSSLFKLYHQEAGTAEVEEVLTNNTVTAIFLSELTKIEFASTVWKNVRIGLISETQAKVVLEAWETDNGKYIFVPIDNVVIEQAKLFIEKYGLQGLPSLDSIQLSTAVHLKSNVDLFISSDKLLNSFLQQEALPVLIA